MALLDPKETILDIQLTHRGRQLLAKNQLNFIYYAFSDEGINYSGSLAAASWSGSIDNYVFRNMSFEEGQRKDIDLSSYLYTVPSKSKKIPEFITTPATGSVLRLERKYRSTSVALTNAQINTLGKPLDIVARGTISKTNRNQSYILEQNVANTGLLDVIKKR